MRSSVAKLQTIADKIVRIDAQREALVASAFDALECQYPALAQMLLEDIGNRQRAAHWMCTPHRACGGELPCALVAAGDEDKVWDILAGAHTVGNDMRRVQNTRLTAPHDLNQTAS